MSEIRKLSEFKSFENSRLIYVNEGAISRLMPSEFLSEIISYLGKGRLPLKYTYCGDGARLQDDVANNLEGEFILDSSVLMSMSSDILDILRNFRAINLIDVGCGDGLPAKEFLSFLDSQKKLNAYLPVDISRETMSLAQDNLRNKSDIPNEKLLEGVLFDFEKQELEISNSLIQSAEVANLLLMLGGTLGNYPTFKLQIELLRRLTKYVPNCYIFITSDIANTNDETEYNIDQSTQLRFLPRLLGLQDSDFNIYYKYQKEQEITQYYLKINSNVTLVFKNERKSVVLSKNSKIVIYEHKSDIPQLVEKKCFDAGLKLKLIKYQDHEDRTFIYYLCSKIL